MNATVVVTGMVMLVVILLVVGAPVKPVRFVMVSMVKLGVGALFLFFFNVFAGTIGLHIPINVVTTIISGFLGVFGVIALAAIQLFIIP